MLAMSFGQGVWTVLGLVVMVLVWKLGMGTLRALSAPPMPAPEPGELRKVNVKYRCDVCGVELKMTMAPDDDPPPPKHCLEDMIEVAPVFE